MAIAKSILIVDDEPKIIEVLEGYLAEEGFQVDKALDGPSAIEKVKGHPHDLVILDLKLPGISGIDVFREIRSRADTPVIILTSRSEEIDRIVGLELGADDYIGKPFSPREVVARVKTILRRAARAESGHQRYDAEVQESEGSTNRVLQVGGLVIDSQAHEVRIGGKEINLTPTEFRILEVLAEHPGRTFTRAQLLDKTKAENLEVFDRTLDRHIANLRHKIESDASKPRYVLTVFGVGYKMSRP